MKLNESSTLVVYNGTNTENFDYSTVNLDNSKEIGIHCGTLSAVKKLGYKYVNQLTLETYSEYKCNFDITSIWSSLELANNYLNDTDLVKELRAHSDSPNKYLEYSKIYRKWFINKGYNLISYINEIEDAGSTNYIILDTKIICGVSPCDN